MNWLDHQGVSDWVPQDHLGDVCQLDGGPGVPGSSRKYLRRIKIFEPTCLADSSPRPPDWASLSAGRGSCGSLRDSVWPPHSCSWSSYSEDRWGCTLYWEWLDRPRGKTSHQHRNSLIRSWYLITIVDQQDREERRDWLCKEITVRERAGMFTRYGTEKAQTQHIMKVSIYRKYRKDFKDSLSSPRRRWCLVQPFCDPSTSSTFHFGLPSAKGGRL